MFSLKYNIVDNRSNIWWMHYFNFVFHVVMLFLKFSTAKFLLLSIIFLQVQLIQN